MNRPHAYAALAAALLAFNAGNAAAQLYKWTDERGRVTYSNQLPVDAKAAQKTTVVEDRVSVYSPDAALLRAVETDRLNANRAATDRRDPPPAVAMLGTPSAAPADAAGPQVYDYPYVVGGGFYRPQRPLHKVPQVRLPAGATAGNTVGLYSIIPGSSAPVPGTWSPVAPQPAPKSRWDEPRPMPHGGYGGQGWRR